MPRQSFLSRVNQIMATSDPVLTITRLLHQEGHLPFAPGFSLAQYEKLRSDKSLDLVAGFGAFEFKVTPKT